MQRRCCTAAVRLLESDAHHGLALSEADAVEHERRHVRALRGAHALWPPIGTRDPEPFPDFRRQAREIGYDLILYRLLESKSESAKKALAALRAEPEVREAVALRKELAPKRPVPFDWLLGRLAEDAALTELGATAFQPITVLSTEIRERLFPGAESKARRAFVQAGARAKGSPRPRQWPCSRRASRARSFTAPRRKRGWRQALGKVLYPATVTDVCRRHGRIGARLCFVSLIALFAIACPARDAEHAPSSPGAAPPPGPEPDPFPAEQGAAPPAGAALSDDAPTCDHSQCGEAPMYPTEACADGRHIGGRGPCVRFVDGRCRWTRLICPEKHVGAECAPGDCGPAPVNSEWECADETVTGRMGPCLRGQSGDCLWTHRRCPYPGARAKATPPPPAPAPSPAPAPMHACQPLPSDAELSTWEVRSICAPGSGPAPPSFTRIRSLSDGTHIIESPRGCFRARYRRCYTKCLPPNVRIATPSGSVPIDSVSVGMPVWTLDGAGHRVAGVVLGVSSVPVRGPHHVQRIVLGDGRSVTASLLHPILGRRPIQELRLGETYDGATVERIEILPYEGDRTYDILPSHTGAYWANDILLGSTLE